MPQIKYIHGNLFESLTNNPNPTLVQCISADYAMGKGIAVEFQKRFHIRETLRQNMPDEIDCTHYLQDLQTNWDVYGLCATTECNGIIINNLITKMYYYNKPTRKSMQDALKGLRTSCFQYKTKYLAMPKIGSGLDRLSWNNTEKDIQNILGNVPDLKIEVYYL